MKKLATLILILTVAAGDAAQKPKTAADARRETQTEEAR